MDNECEIWNMGATLNAFVISARSPEKLWLLRKTSRWTSFAMPSMVPGFDKPNASRLSWNPTYVFAIRWMTAFSVKKLRGSLSFSVNVTVAMVGEVLQGVEEEEGRRLWEVGRNEAPDAEGRMGRGKQKFAMDAAGVGCGCMMAWKNFYLRRTSARLVQE